MVNNAQSWWWRLTIDDFPIAQPWGISQRPAMVDYRRVDLQPGFWGMAYWGEMMWKCSEWWTRKWPGSFIVMVCCVAVLVRSFWLKHLTRGLGETNANTGPCDKMTLECGSPCSAPSYTSIHSCVQRFGHLGPNPLTSFVLLPQHPSSSGFDLQIRLSQATS
jgi:hypothetical protein